MPLRHSRWIVAPLAAVAMLAPPTVADAQCPVGATCYFGTDLTPSNGIRPANVNSAAARSGFLGDLSGDVGTETFEGIAAGTATPLALSFPGAGTANLSGNGSVSAVAGTGTGDSRYPVSGNNFFLTSSSAGGAGFSIAFGSPVSAFGFYGTDVGDFASQLSLQFTLVGGGTTTWTLPYVASNGNGSARDASLLFAGFISSTAFERVDFVGTDADDVLGFDDMTIASRSQVVHPPSVAPEPATIALTGIGLLGLALVGRRRLQA